MERVFFSFIGMGGKREANEMKSNSLISITNPANANHDQSSYQQPHAVGACCAHRRF
jgi:hypothetical protein